MPDSPVLDLGFARLDLQRERRQGLAEVVYAPGKTAAQITAIAAGLLRHNTGPVLVTRIDGETADAVRAGVTASVAADGAQGAGRAEGADAGRAEGTGADRAEGPDARVAGAGDGGATVAGAGGWCGEGHYDAGARLLSWRPAPAGEFTVAVVSAGTADGPVAAEARGVATAIGLDARGFSDVGVAGLDRVLRIRPQLADADAVIVVAGMEGALASVIGGLVGCPVIAVPTSVGYGAALDGVTALLAMHASCAAGVTVVNIDSGFGAAMAAYRIARAFGQAGGR